MEINDISPYLEGLYQTAVLQDWAQTRQIARNPDNYYEDKLKNVIGEHPSQSKVNAYMLPRMALHYAVGKKLPDSLKLPYQLATLAEVASTIKKNKDIGLDYNKPSLLLGLALTGFLGKNGVKNISPAMIDEKTPGLVFNRKF